MITRKLTKNRNIALLTITATILVFAVAILDQKGNEMTAHGDSPKTHEIELQAVNMTDMDPDDPMDDRELYGYKMVSHIIKSDDKNAKSQEITHRYNNEPTVPGPTIVVDEGDVVKLTLDNKDIKGMVSIHTHGVHYNNKDSDGTLKAINGFSNQGVYPEGCIEETPPKVDCHDDKITYTWVAGKGTAGTWPYHDHTLGTEGNHHGGHEISSESTVPHGSSLVGSEHKGLFGAIIVNPKGQQVNGNIDGELKTVPTSKIEKEFILYMVGTRFAGMEIDNSDGTQTPLWENPTLTAKQNGLVRFHILSLGSDTAAFFKMKSNMPMEHRAEEFHSFHIHGHRWIEAGTQRTIDVRTMSPADVHTFVVRAGESVGPGQWMYHCHVLHHMEMGMMGVFNVTPKGGPSVPGPKFPVMTM